MYTIGPVVRLQDVLRQVSRPETVNPEKMYQILGAHWYGNGLFIKDVKLGAHIRATTVYRVEEGDFVYNRLFAWKGSFAVATSGNAGCYVSNEFPCFHTDKTRLDPFYLWYYFKQPTVWTDVFGLSTGSTSTSRNRLKEAELLSLEIPLPPLDEQRRIVAHIDALATQIAAARGLRYGAIDEAEAFLLNVGRALFGSTSQSDWIPLGRYVSRIENGWSPEAEKRPASHEEWGVLKVGAVTYGFFDPSENKALPVGLAPKTEYEVKAGDLLMSRANTRAWVGAVALVLETRPRLMLSDKIFRFHFYSNVPIEKHYLWYVLKSPALRTQIEAAASGTSPSMKNISKEKVQRLLIPPHSLEEQREILTYINSLQAQVDRLKHLQADITAELDVLLPSLLDRAFRGEL